ncbi:MAG: TIM barrel protein [Rubricoccaceae bacterium]|nr:TIM barrel protein [Rubricoccaceae bacterium]
MLPALVTDTVSQDLGRAVHYTLLWGLEGVVLRTVGGPDERVPFVNEARLRTRLTEADLPVVAVDPGLFEGAPERRAVWMNDLAAFDETAAFCRRVGCGIVLVGALAPPDAPPDLDAAAGVLREAGAFAARGSLRLAVRNEGACASGEGLADLLARVDHPAVGAAWQPAEAVAAGHDPAAGLAALHESPGRITYVAVRDVEGAAGWPGQLAALARAGYEGPLGLEVHGRAQDGLKSATALLTMRRAALREAR